MPECERRLCEYIVQTYPLIPPESIARVGIRAIVLLHFPAWANQRQESFERALRLTIAGSTPGDYASGYYVKTSAAIAKINACFGTLECPLDAPICQQLNFYGAPVVIPDP